MNDQEKQYHKMTRTPIPNLIINLGIPTIISMLITSIYNMADTYFVGTISTSASGATGVVFSLMAILMAFGFMFGHGAGSNISRQLGAKQIDAARTYASTSFWLSVIVGFAIGGIGLIFLDPMLTIMGSTPTILPYARGYAIFILLAGGAFTSSCVMNNILRYEGKAFYAMIGLTSGGILNMFLDYVTVRLLNMGIVGAGLATCISQYVSMFILLIPYLQHKTQSQFGIRYFTLKLDVVRNICMNGMPSLARQGLNSISVMVLNLACGVYGDAAVAAISITTRIVNFLFCVAVGIGQGLQPVAAFNYGAKLFSRVRKGFSFSLKLGTFLMFVFAIFAYFQASTLVGFFRDDILVKEIGTRALRYQCISLVFMPLSMYGNMLFQAIGKSAVATFLATLRSGVVLIPVVLIMAYTLGLAGLEMAQSISEMISALASIPFLVSFFRHLPTDYEN